ncbi:MAG: TRAP transporter substrate-binding protein DctP [Rhodospirillaceae bacterium]
MNKILIALLSVILCTYCYGATAETMLKMGFTLAASSHYGVAATAFAEEIARKTAGRYAVQLYPDGTLAQERELLEGAQDGEIDLMIVSTGPVDIFVPETLITDIPFLFHDYNHARAVLDGPIGQELLALFPKHDLIALAWGENGFRHLTNNVRPVQGPQDLQGLRVRTMQNPLHVLTFATLGARPTPMQFSDIFEALRQHTIDGQENPTPTVVKADLAKVQKYLSLTGHVYSPALVIMSPARWNALDESDRTIFRDAARRAAAVMRSEIDRTEQLALSQLRDAGMQILTVDRAPFEQAVAPVFADCARRFGAANIERIRNFRN